jgi:hypothetical protein
LYIFGKLVTKGRKKKNVEKDHTHTQEDNFPNITFLLMIIKHIDVFKNFAYNTYYFKMVVPLTLKACTSPL